ncbi:MAG TPA: hypothetical protein VJV23_12940, partial [Candidatus Polarisedimenticolia bacterium]|nr:hypothetical protein [Candidatus Polarisedimenticolia bacterium]
MRRSGMSLAARCAGLLLPLAAAIGRAAAQAEAEAPGAEGPVHVLESGRLLAGAGAGAPFSPAQGLPPLSAIAGPAAGRLYALAPSDDGRTTALLALSLPSMEPLERWELRGEGRLLEVTPDGAWACVAARAGGGRRKGPDGGAGGRWILAVVDLRQGRLSPPTALAMEPLASALLPDEGAWPGHRLALAGEGRVATFTLDPLQPSWFYKSPGINHAVVPLAEPGAVAVLRGETLAVISPKLRPRVEGRARLTDDDATSTIPLPSAGVALAVLKAGEAAVLHDGGLLLSRIDPASGKVLSQERLERPAQLARAGSAVWLIAGSGSEAAVRRLHATPASPPDPAAADARPPGTTSPEAA